ncbi:MAG: TIGR01777 family oxidoreductase [Chitinophagales bacterium]|nr:TIGR01777 family oxidoreductase [Chitinophagales bacterium]
MKTILVTGASGLIGQKLIALLLEENYTVKTLTRAPFKTNEKVQQFIWDVELQQIDLKALEEVNTIIHLAGESVAGKRWTKTQKERLHNSRIDSTRLLFNTLSKIRHSVKNIISASAVGYYGDRGAALLNEESPMGTGFLAELCRDWEREVMKFSTLNIREVRGRIGIVLSKTGGALPEMMKTFPMGIAGYFAKENLYYPWIHIDDLCAAFLYCIENENCNGAFNFTGPAPVLQKEIITTAVETFHSKAIVAPIPPFILKLALGEMAEMVLNSQRCIPEKLSNQGFRFQFSTIQEAMRHL